jgi:Cu(I)/Ag(I) efflux system membrane fusion protein
MKRLSYLMIAAAMIAAVNACSKTASGKEAEISTEAPAIEPESEITHAHLAVNGSCEMCKKRIESAAGSVAGVASAEWDGEAQELHLNFDAAETSLEAVSKALARTGHDTGLDKALDDVYNALPGCCKYR